MNNTKVQNPCHYGGAKSPHNFSSPCCTRAVVSGTETSQQDYVCVEYEVSNCLSAKLFYWHTDRPTDKLLHLSFASRWLALNSKQTALSPGR